MRKNRTQGTEAVVWHCSATPPSEDIGSAQIDIWHKAKGWDGIGYALVIRRDGRLECGEDFKKAAAHVKGWNNKSVGICLIGGVDEDGKAENNFTELQWAAAKHVFEFFTLLYPRASHVGHRDLSPDADGDGRIQKDEYLKECPCFSVRQWIENDLNPVEDMYAEWEINVAVEVPDVEVTVEEVLSEAFIEPDDTTDQNGDGSDDDDLPDSDDKPRKRRGRRHKKSSS